MFLKALRTNTKYTVKARDGRKPQRCGNNYA